MDDKMKPLDRAMRKAGDFAELMQRGQSGSVVQRELPPPVAHLPTHGSTNKRDGGALCQMDYVSRWPDKIWTCRVCGQSVTRNGTDGHPAQRCLGKRDGGADAELEQETQR